MSKVNRQFWDGKRVFLTGHTGFKGGWLSLWLQALGAEVHGFALPPPTNPSLFDIADVETGMASSIVGDIRDYVALDRALASVLPEIVIHMAAQPLVRLSYREPVATYQTNVMGTVHILEAARRTGSVRAILNVTTDKCYENREWDWGYRESEPMGGYDPYSNSKGCSELVTSAYRRSFMADRNIALASARAGNVIGGGDWAADRLIPDVLRSIEAGASVVIRYPKAIRPWQHVLEPLSGYLVLVQHLFEPNGAIYADGWNFGPRDEDCRSVNWVVKTVMDKLGRGELIVENGPQPHEAHFLKLDISKSANQLGWRPTWCLDAALEKIVTWHEAYSAGADMKAICLSQIAQFVGELN